MEYDKAISDIQSVEQALRDYLDQQKKILGCRVKLCSVLLWQMMAVGCSSS